MKVFVKAKPKSKIAKIEKMDETHFSICVKEPPEKNKANKALIKALAEHFGVAPSRVKLVSGASARQKVFEIS